MPKEVIISLEEVWKVYKMGDVEVNALRGLSLRIKRGEFVSIQGPSGSGKSTAMNMIGASHLGESRLAQVRGKKIGFVFQQFNLIQTLTALENVMLPMTFQGVGETEGRERATKLLELVELGDRMNHLPNELSGGQQQRVAIARALANEPEVILADEPTGNLDSRTGETVVKFLVDLHKRQKKTIILVTHDERLSEFADRVVYLRDGIAVKSLENHRGERR